MPSTLSTPGARIARPAAIVFDVIGTLFSTEPLGQALARAGLSESALNLWFARFLRDAFALDLAGTYKPFREVAIGALVAIAQAENVDFGEQKAAEVIEGIANLPVHSDVRPALESLRRTGIRVAALTNGNEATTRQMFANVGLVELIDVFISIDEVHHWKPHPDVYLHAAGRLKVDPKKLGLVAAHDWDIEGATRAGLIAAAVRRKKLPFSPAMTPPAISSESLTGLIDQLLALPTE